MEGRLLCWVAVAYGGGIGGYFALRFEPSGLMWAASVICAAVLFGLATSSGRLRVPALLGAASLAGLLTAGAHAHFGAAPVLTFRYYGPVEGRVVDVDISQSGRTRVTLDRIRLRDMRIGTVPARVRVSLHGGGEPMPGARMAVTAHLSPPMGPVEPGGFDFSRRAWFEHLGAVGYARTPLVLLREPAGRDGAMLRFRRTLAAAVADHIGGAAGGIAAAIVTGDRSFIPEETTRALRRSNLSHLLAISGLHMGLLTGFVFGSLRLILAILSVGARIPARAIAASAALLVATLYLGMSGGNVSTQRAYVMVAVAMGAVIVGRRALTLRAVALAAIIVLALHPIAITGPGFQMSFAATIALVGAFEAIRRTPDAPKRSRWITAAVGTVLSSAVAGAATAPFAAAHFNIIAQYGLAANLAAVPVMATVVMPSAVLAALLWPLGLEGVGLSGMALGLEWIITVAQTVSSWPNAVRMVPTPPMFILPLLGMFGCALALVTGRARIAPTAALAATLGTWLLSDRPELLIDEAGGLVGIMTPEGRALSREQGSGFAARVWLENDGDDDAQEVAAGRPADSTVDGLRIVHLKGAREVETAGAHCLDGVWLIVAAETDLVGPCRITDIRDLKRTGAIAVLGGRITTARDRTGIRPWSAWRSGN